MHIKKIAVVASDSDLARDLLTKLNPSIFEIHCFTKNDIDVRSYDSCLKLRDLMPDIVVNFAGVLRPGTIMSCSIDDFNLQVDVNFRGAFHVMRAALEGNPDCRIVQIGSKAAHSPREARSAYCGSKSGLYEMSKCAILERLDVFILNLGPCATKMRRSLCLSEPPSMILQPSEVSERILRIIENREWQRDIFLDKLEHRYH